MMGTNVPSRMYARMLKLAGICSEDVDIKEYHASGVDLAQACMEGRVCMQDGYAYDIRFQTYGKDPNGFSASAMTGLHTIRPRTCITTSCNFLTCFWDT